jgi:hypothetical protein
MTVLNDVLLKLSASERAAVRRDCAVVDLPQKSGVQLDNQKLTEL